MYSMKFGADLKNSVVPEWAPGYIAYDALKAQIKAISGAEADERADNSDGALNDAFNLAVLRELKKAFDAADDDGNNVVLASWDIYMALMIVLGVGGGVPLLYHASRAQGRAPSAPKDGEPEGIELEPTRGRGKDLA